MSEMRIGLGSLVLACVLCLASSCSKRKLPWDTSPSPARSACVRELKQLMKDAVAVNKLLLQKGDSLVAPAQGLERLMDRVDNLQKSGLIDDYMHEDFMERLAEAARCIGLEPRKGPRTGQPKLGPRPTAKPVEVHRAWASYEVGLFYLAVAPELMIVEGKAGGDTQWRDGKLRSAAWRVSMGLRGSANADTGWERAPAAETKSAAPAAATAKPDAAKAEVARRVIGFLQTQAAAGSPSAQYELGVRYLNGDGVNKDLEMARKWLRAAADKGNAQAAAKLHDVDTAK